MKLGYLSHMIVIRMGDYCGMYGNVNCSLLQPDCDDSLHITLGQRFYGNSEHSEVREPSSEY